MILIFKNSIYIQTIFHLSQAKHIWIPVLALSLSLYCVVPKIADNSVGGTVNSFIGPHCGVLFCFVLLSDPLSLQLDLFNMLYKDEKGLSNLHWY